MQNVLVEINKDFTLMDLHANFSLSQLAASVEGLPGVVLVSQPSIYDLEVYLDRRYFVDSAQRLALKTRLKVLFTEAGVPIQI